MAGNTFGTLFRITTFGESHGPMMGLIIDGCPAGLDLDMTYVQAEVDRRRPGQSAIVTQRKEPDRVEVVSGTFEGKTTGTPLTFLIMNKDQKSKDYTHIKDKYRPSHADMTYQSKYGLRDYRGGGRSSARETVARVVAGAVAKLILKHSGITIHAGVTAVGHLSLDTPLESLDWSVCEHNLVRCPEAHLAEQMEALITEVMKSGDTIGGQVSCVIYNCPVGLGDPVFDKLHADLGKAMLSINAVKGFEIGSGFSSIAMKGSAHNDQWISTEGSIETKTNNSGGVQGGISNGMPIVFNVAFKPLATIMKDQMSVDQESNPVVLKGKGRHDPCVVPRAVPIVEAMAALVILDHHMRQRVVKLEGLS